MYNGTSSLAPGRSTWCVVRVGVRVGVRVRVRVRSSLAPGRSTWWRKVLDEEREVVTKYPLAGVPAHLLVYYLVYYSLTTPHLDGVAQLAQVDATTTTTTLQLLQQ